MNPLSQHTHTHTLSESGAVLVQMQYDGFMRLSDCFIDPIWCSTVRDPFTDSALRGHAHTVQRKVRG